MEIDGGSSARIRAPSESEKLDANEAVLGDLGFLNSIDVLEGKSVIFASWLIVYV